MAIIISTDDAPAAIGPYSQAVKTGNLLFVSGQLPLDSGSGDIIGNDIESQTRQVLDNLHAIVRAADASLSGIVKCTCFLSDMNAFALFNQTYAEYFGDTAPARECVEVARLPKDVMVEISAICELE
ncbi:MAG: RidA family protein [Desulfobacteraceae bacterium]|nr:RidA family protein [Desulfobacteraceae bacterium]